MREVDLDGKVPALIADLTVHSIWQNHRQELYTVRVVDTDVQSYRIVGIFRRVKVSFLRRKLFSWVLISF